MSLLARPAVTPPGDAMLYATPAELEHAMDDSLASWVLGFDLRVLCCGLVAGGWAVRAGKGHGPDILLGIFYCYCQFIIMHVKTYILFDSVIH
jgi:hypothetical protein